MSSLKKYFLPAVAALSASALILSTFSRAQLPPPPSAPAPRPDAVVVGAGIAGLSAAIELAQGGAHVTVIDMSSIFGGHAVMATGDLCMVGTTFQESQGIHDTPDLAYNDIMKWGEDANAPWVRYYVDHSRHDLYDWIVELGMTFDNFITPTGNSVPRTHRTHNRGLGLVSPIYRACLHNPSITFVWNTRLDRLLTADRRVTGVAATNVRTGKPVEFSARVVVLATGGFQSNLDVVRANWPANLPFPEHLLAGSGINSLGSALAIAKTAGASVTRLDHQWNYITGLPDPRFPGTPRGLNAHADESIWVNADGKRFLPELISAKLGLPILLQQKGATYWSIFDEPQKRDFWVAGSGWEDFAVIDQLIFSNSDLVKSAATIEELAAKSGLPAAALAATLKHYNEMVDAGTDTDFTRFGPGKKFKPKTIRTPPFYAVQFFPLTRKSMGGVVIDLSCRVLDAEQHIIPGLYAAGELAGLAGINGKAPLEGTFLGPSIITGRVAGRAALTEFGLKPGPDHAPPSGPADPIAPNPLATTELCLKCHELPKLLAESRPGYWHFEKVHRVVVAKNFECTKCHTELTPTYLPETHKINRLVQVQVCVTCHQGEEH